MASSARVLVMRSSGLACEHQQVGGRAGGDRAELAALAPAGRGVAGGADQRLHRRQSGVDHHLELEVFEEALEAPGRAGVGAERDADAGIGDALEVGLGGLERGLVLLALRPARARLELGLARRDRQISAEMSAA